MKYRFLLILFFVLSLTYGQVADLGKLSRGKFYSSAEIKDKHNNTRGYFLLYETDKVAKETYQLEYVLLDENLTKVTNGFITEMKYESWFFTAKKINVEVVLEGRKLLIGFADDIAGEEYFKRYRILDIASNELSDPFIYNKNTLVKNPEFDRKHSNVASNQSEEITFYNGVGLMAHSKTMNKKLGVTDRRLVRYDDELNELWTFKYDQIKAKKLTTLSYLNSDNEVIVMLNHYLKNSSVTKYLNELSVTFINSENGNLIKEVPFPKDDYTYRVVDCAIKDGRIYVMGNMSEKTKEGFVHDSKGKGLYKFVFDKETGELLDKKYLLWENLLNNKSITINKNGVVKKEGKMYIHNMLMLDNGKVIAVGETFLNKPIITNNMYLFELAEDFSVSQCFEIEKFRNKFSNTNAYSSTIKRYGLFDFMDYQDLGDDEYLFFLNDNEKNSKNRKKTTLYGIISYSDGEFKRQTLNLKTETSTIFATSAKKGYMLLVENFDEETKATELRLEKVNF